MVAVPFIIDGRIGWFRSIDCGAVYCRRSHRSGPLIVDGQMIAVPFIIDGRISRLSVE
jgi:hypothetical protein